MGIKTIYFRWYEQFGDVLVEMWAVRPELKDVKRSAFAGGRVSYSPQQKAMLILRNEKQQSKEGLMLYLPLLEKGEISTDSFAIMLQNHIQKYGFLDEETGDKIKAVMKKVKP